MHLSSLKKLYNLSSCLLSCYVQIFRQNQIFPSVLLILETYSMHKGEYDWTSKLMIVEGFPNLEKDAPLSETQIVTKL